jgi:hypothetical protein
MLIKGISSKGSISMNYFKQCLIAAVYIITSPIACHVKQSIEYIDLTNSTDHTIKNIKVRFMFIGNNDASDQHHVPGKVRVRLLQPGETVRVDPKEARRVGLINPTEVYEHFDNPRIQLLRIDSSNAHRGFGKRGSAHHTALEFITYREKDIIRSTRNADEDEDEEDEDDEVSS